MGERSSMTSCERSKDEPEVKKDTTGGIKESEFSNRNDFLIAKGGTYMKKNELNLYKKHREEVVYTQKNGPLKAKQTNVSPDRKMVDGFNP